MVSEWLYGAIALLVGLHVLTMLYAYRHRGDPAGATGQGDTEPRRGSATDDSTTSIDVRDCGVKNERTTSSPEVHRRPDEREPAASADGPISAVLTPSQAGVEPAGSSAVVGLRSYCPYSVERC